MAFHCYRLRLTHESIQNLSQMIGKTISVAAYYIENRLFNIILFSIRTSNKIESINKRLQLLDFKYNWTVKVTIDFKKAIHSNS